MSDEEIERRAAAILSEVQRRVAIPANDRLTALADNEMLFLVNLLLRLKPRRTLEVGLGWGYSAAAILAAGSPQHMVIELERDTPRVKQGAANAMAFASPDRLQILWGSSDVWLPELLRAGTAADFALVDGGHRFDDAFVDFHYLRRIVRPGGVVLLDDHWMPSIQTLCAWIESNLGAQWQRSPLSDFNFAAFRRTETPDDRQWNHFRPFATAHRELRSEE